MANNPCGSIIASACVPYTGKKLTFLTDANQIPCNASLNDVIAKVDASLKTLQDSTDVSSHEFLCGTLTTPKTVKSVLQDHANKICAIAALVDALGEQVAGQEISSELVTMDLGELAAAAAPCEVSENTYTLISILNVLKNEIIAIKTHLGI